MLAQCVCVFSLDLSELNFSGQKCKAKELKITLLDAALLTERHITGEMTDVWIGVSYVFSFPSKAQGAEALTV